MTCFSKQFIPLKTTNLLTFVKLIDLFRKTRLLKNTHVLKLTCFERSVIKRLEYYEWTDRYYEWTNEYYE